MLLPIFIYSIGPVITKASLIWATYERHEEEEQCYWDGDNILDGYQGKEPHNQCDKSSGHKKPKESVSSLSGDPPAFTFPWILLLPLWVIRSPMLLRRSILQ